MLRQDHLLEAATERRRQLTEELQQLPSPPAQEVLEEVWAFAQVAYSTERDFCKEPPSKVPISMFPCFLLVACLLQFMHLGFNSVSFYS